MAGTARATEESANGHKNCFDIDRTSCYDKQMDA